LKKCVNMLYYFLFFICLINWAALPINIILLILINNQTQDILEYIYDRGPTRSELYLEETEWRR
jgi:hypothetical protein